VDVVPFVEFQFIPGIRGLLARLNKTRRVKEQVEGLVLEIEESLVCEVIHNQSLLGNCHLIKWVKAEGEVVNCLVHWALKSAIREVRRARREDECIAGDVSTLFPVEVVGVQDQLVMLWGREYLIPEGAKAIIFMGPL